MIISAAISMAILIEFPFLNLKKILFERRVHQDSNSFDVNKNVIEKFEKKISRKSQSKTE